MAKGEVLAERLQMNSRYRSLRAYEVFFILA